MVDLSILNPWWKGKEYIKGDKHIKDFFGGVVRQPQGISISSFVFYRDECPNAVSGIAGRQIEDQKFLLANSGEFGPIKNRRVTLRALFIMQYTVKLFSDTH